MSWFAWLFRRRERERAFLELKRLKEEYSEQGGRVIRLSARTELLRRSTGSTQKSFEYVEKSFATATEEYARVQSVLQNLEAELDRGRDQGLPEARKAVSGIGPALDELERHLQTWERRWQEVPLELEQAEASLQSLSSDLRYAEDALNRSLPPRAGLESLGAFLQRARNTLLEGNPIEAGNQVRDFALARAKIAAEISAYRSGVGALEQVEASLAGIRESAAGNGGSILALTAAEELVPRLRGALAEGRFDPFQADLLQIQNWLTQASGRS